MRVEQGRSAHGTFPALCQVFSSCLVVPDLPVYCTSPQQGEVVPMPLLQHPTHLSHLLLPTPLLDPAYVTSGELTPKCPV